MHSGEVDYTLVSVNYSIFFVVVLPSLLLSLLCALAVTLPTSRVINKKIRFILINILISDIINWFSFTGYYLGWSTAHLIRTEEDILCKISIFFFTVANVQKFTTCASYSLNVYIFIKYGEKKLKWYALVSYFVATWIVSVILGITPFFDVSSVIANNGFCIVNADSLVFKIAIAFILVIAVFFLCFQLVCSLLTIMYVKKNALEGNTAVKKAVAKMLACLTAASILSFISIIIPIVTLFIPYNKLTYVIIYHVLRRLLLIIPTITTPIVTMMLLKPIRVAMMKISKKVFCFCRPNNQIAPAPEVATMNASLQPLSTSTTATTAV